jgi:hypothetical protein
MGKFSRSAPAPPPFIPPAPPPPPPVVEDPAKVAAKLKASNVAAARRGISGTITGAVLGDAGSANTQRPTLLGQGGGR